MPPARQCNGAGEAHHQSLQGRVDRGLRYQCSQFFDGHHLAGCRFHQRRPDDPDPVCRCNHPLLRSASLSRWHREMLAAVYTTVTRSVELAVQAVRDNDQRAARSVLMLKDTIRDQSEHLLARKATRLGAQDPDYLNLVRLEMA